MELFGYLCSPLCRAKANSHGIQVPVYEGQRSVVEARLWRRTARVVAVVGVVLVVLLGVWTWYVWFGCQPKPTFSIRFNEPVYSGQAWMGAEQVVFLRGENLARYDMKEKKEIWSRPLIDHKKIQADADKSIKEIQALIDRANSEAWENVPKMPSREKLIRRMEKDAAAALELHVLGRNVWVASPGKLVQYSWDNGNPVKEIPVPAYYGGLMALGDELMVIDTTTGKPIVTRVNLNTCDARTEEIGADTKPTPLAGTNPAQPTPGAGLPGSGLGGRDLAGLPIGTPGKNSDKPMDPRKVAEQYRDLSYPAKLALPAVLANTMNQERTLAELNDTGRRGPPTLKTREPNEDLSIIPTKTGFVQFYVKLIERKVIERSTMKPSTGKSVLNGEVNVTQSAEVANELLNEMQRSRGGGVIYEDRSRYRATLRAPDSNESWTGEMVGYPAVFPLQTVNVLASEKSITVLDKHNKKLWQSTLTYNVHGGFGALDEDHSIYGEGPCVERKDSLYIFDEGVLSAFDLATGNARWRLPSVGVTGLFFDDKDMLYVNTSTASPESIRYPAQIDVRRSETPVIMKIEPRTGKTLWTSEPGGLINYVSGKFIYTVQSYMPAEPDEDDPYRLEGDNQKPPYLRIKRLNPRNGREVWEHFQQRAPLDVQFDKNTIKLVFKKEIQVLKSLAL